MLKKIFFTIICSGLFFTPCKSQVITDSLANDFRSFAAKHFSRYRTVNLFWETKSTHDYTLKLGGKEIEQGKKKDLHTIKFSTMIPIIRQKKISLYANVKYDCYKSESNNNDTQSAVFTTDTYNCKNRKTSCDTFSNQNVSFLKSLTQNELRDFIYFLPFFKHLSKAF